MIERSEDRNGESRREFLRSAGAGMLAGGTTLLATGLAAQGQDPKPATTPAPATVAPAQAPVATSKPTVPRASGTAATNLVRLGPLKELSGTWVGKGFNTISLPDFDNPEGAQNFRVKLNATREILEFTKIGGNIPNRGSVGQNDIALFGLTYLQRISDTLTNEPLHIEPGLWLNVPATVKPVQPTTVVRMGSIPHGTNILAQGFSVTAPAPLIAAVSTTPLKKNAAGVFVPFPLNDPYLEPFQTVTLPPGFHPSFLQNPNLSLINDISGQNIVETTVLIISTAASKDTAGNAIQAGSVGNIPFLDHNAKVTQLDAIFWIEKVQPAVGDVFLQLQYTQTIILEFLDVKWPHISVATLLKQ